MTASAEPVRFAQVLRNLIENAVRYTRTGHVRVRVEPFVSPESAARGAPSASGTRSAAASDGSSTAGPVQFAVHDTGPGLPPLASERLKSAAVPFESGSDGTGMGLFVSCDVLLQRGGRINVQTLNASHPEGPGITFKVSLPAVQVQDTAPPVGRLLRCPVAHPSLNVLVVDDLSDMRESLSDMRCRLGHACRAVGSAAEVRPLLASTHFDVVLIDLEIEGTAGRALATQIRQGSGLNTASMLMLISAAENQAAGQLWPVDGFLQKPIDGQDLARLIGSRTPLPASRGEAGRGWRSAPRESSASPRFELPRP